jgi:hypothetical protein
VVVLTYKNPAPLLEEIRAEGVHNAEKLEIFSLEPAFLASLDERLAKDNEWNVLHDEGTLTVSVGDESFVRLSGHNLRWLPNRVPYGTGRAGRRSPDGFARHGNAPDTRGPRRADGSAEEDDLAEVLATCVELC